MSRQYTKDIICPFFQEHSSNALSKSTREEARARLRWEKLRIRCEGLKKGGHIVLEFKTEEQRMKHRKCFCATYNYKECPIAKALDAKYNEKEN